MNLLPPHYTLVFELRNEQEIGHWRFALRSADGSDHLEADDVEPGVRGERLALLAVVRGLEALDQPSRVTLKTPSTYVQEGIRYGLSEWRKNGWRWECFGQMVPVKNSDLWQRIDRALRFHQVECRTWRIDKPHCHAPHPVEHPVTEREPKSMSAEVTTTRPIHNSRRRSDRFLRLALVIRRWHRHLTQWRTTLAPVLRFG